MIPTGFRDLFMSRLVLIFNDLRFLRSTNNHYRLVIINFIFSHGHHIEFDYEDGMFVHMFPARKIGATK